MTIRDNPKCRKSFTTPFNDSNSISDKRKYWKIKFWWSEPVCVFSVLIFLGSCWFLVSVTSGGCRVCLETADSDGRCKRAGRAGLTVNTPLALTAGELSSQLSQYTGRRDLQSREGGGHSTPVTSNSPLREKYIMKTIMLSWGSYNIIATTPPVQLLNTSIDKIFK